MTAWPPAADDLIRPAPLSQRLILACLPPIARLLRTVRPILFGLVTRYDDVRDVLGDHTGFNVKYEAKLREVVGATPFVLGIDDGAAHVRRAGAMHRALAGDGFADRLAARVDAAAKAWLAAHSGRFDGVAYVRDIGRTAFCAELGIAETADVPLDWLTMRAFEYVFVGTSDTITPEVADAAWRLRVHVAACMAAAKSAPDARTMLGRALRLQRQSDDLSNDDDIAAALLGLLVGGLPQLPMAGPQALNQLLLRAAAHEAADEAATGGDDAALFALIREALRFDPLAPMVVRRAAFDRVVAAGTSHATLIRRGTTVRASVASAMYDGRRIAASGSFDAARDPAAYLHFGDGLHSCFGHEIARIVLTRSLGALLRHGALRRDSRYVKRGLFAYRLPLRFDRLFDPPHGDRPDRQFVGTVGTD